MLEKVSEAGFAGYFIARADAVRDLYADHREVPVFKQDKLKTIVERLMRRIAQVDPGCCAACCQKQCQAKEIPDDPGTAPGWVRMNALHDYAQGSFRVFMHVGRSAATAIT